MNSDYSTANSALDLQYSSTSAGRNHRGRLISNNVPRGQNSPAIRQYRRNETQLEDLRQKVASLRTSCEEANSALAEQNETLSSLRSENEALRRHSVLPRPGTTSPYPKEPLVLQNFPNFSVNNNGPPVSSTTQDWIIANTYATSAPTTPEVLDRSSWPNDAECDPSEISDIDQHALHHDLHHSCVHDREPDARQIARSDCMPDNLGNLVKRIGNMSVDSTSLSITMNSSEVPVSNSS